MTKRLYVGNLSFKTTEDEVKDLFGRVCAVDSVSFVRDQDTGRLKGFGFVEVPSDDAATVVSQFNGSELGGRALVVNEARPRTTKKW
jgi:RNA recognition motif-containing protein